MAVEKEIGRIQVDSNTDIVIRLTAYRGKEGLDIRFYIKSGAYRGFTKQGIRIPLDKIDELRSLLVRAKDEIRMRPSIL